jgi:Fe-S-cluster containining protein
MKREPLRRIYAEFDVHMNDLVREARRLGHSVPCKLGCDACCYDIAYTTESELEPIVEHILRMSTHLQDKIQRALTNWERRMRAVGISPDLEPEEHPPPSIRQNYYKAKAACPLLDLKRHRCMVYEDRPLVCRGHYLIDEPSSKCANIDKDPSTQNISNREHLIGALGSIYWGGEIPYRLLPYLLQKMLQRAKEIHDVQG